MSRVLVTGATGFVGRHTLAALQAHGYEIHAVAPLFETIVGDGVIYWHQIDLMDPAATVALLDAVRPTHLLHLAWYVEHGKFWTSPENLRWVQSSLQLLQAFAEVGGQRVVMVGTCSEYDARYGYCVENLTPLAPTSLYAASKHALHLLLNAAAPQLGLSAAWARIFFLYGPYESPRRLVPAVITALLDGQPARTSHGNQIRDFLHVADVGGALTALLQSDVTGAVNIASGQPVTLRDIVLEIARQLNPTGKLEFGAFPAPEGEPPVQMASVARLRQEVGWTPHYDLPSGIAHTIRWWQSRRAGSASTQRNEDL